MSHQRPRFLHLTRDRYIQQPSRFSRNPCSHKCQAKQTESTHSTTYQGLRLVCIHIHAHIDHIGPHFDTRADVAQTDAWRGRHSTCQSNVESSGATIAQRKQREKGEFNRMKNAPEVALARAGVVPMKAPGANAAAEPARTSKAQRRSMLFNFFQPVRPSTLLQLGARAARPKRTYSGT